MSLGQLLVALEMKRIRPRFALEAAAAGGLGSFARRQPPQSHAAASGAAARPPPSREPSLHLDRHGVSSAALPGGAASGGAAAGDPSAGAAVLLRSGSSRSPAEESHAAAATAAAEAAGGDQLEARALQRAFVAFACGCRPPRLPDALPGPPLRGLGFSETGRAGAGAEGAAAGATVLHRQRHHFCLLLDRAAQSRGDALRNAIELAFPGVRSACASAASLQAAGAELGQQQDADAVSVALAGPCVLVLLTRGFLRSPSPQVAALHAALLAGRRVVLVHETHHARGGYAMFSDYIQEAAACVAAGGPDVRAAFSVATSIPWHDNEEFLRVSAMRILLAGLLEPALAADEAGAAGATAGAGVRGNEGESEAAAPHREPQPGQGNSTTQQQPAAASAEAEEVHRREANERTAAEAAAAAAAKREVDGLELRVAALQSALAEAEALLRAEREMNDALRASNVALKRQLEEERMSSDRFRRQADGMAGIVSARRVELETRQAQAEAALGEIVSIEQQRRAEHQRAALSSFGPLVGALASPNGASSPDVAMLLRTNGTGNLSSSLRRLSFADGKSDGGAGGGDGLNTTGDLSPFQQSPHGKKPGHAKPAKAATGMAAPSARITAADLAGNSPAEYIRTLDSLLLQQAAAGGALSASPLAAADRRRAHAASTIPSGTIAERFRGAQSPAPGGRHQPLPPINGAGEQQRRGALSGPRRVHS